MNKRSCVMLLVLFSLAFSGCGTTGNQPASIDPLAAYTVRDSQGAVLKLPRKPQRVISVNIASDEILLGLIPPKRIAALSYLSAEPGISHVVETAQTVSVKIRAQTEPIVALQPDLVLVPDWLPAEFPLALRDAGMPVYVFKTAGSIADIRRNIREIAQALGEKEQGEVLVAKMDGELNAITEKLQRLPEAERVTVARVSIMGGSGGAGTSFDDICRHAGVKNAGALAGLDKTGSLTQEQLVRIDPDIFLLPTWDFTNKTDFEKLRNEIQSSPAMQIIKAVRNGRLIQVPDRDLFCTSQYIVQGVRGIATAAYPQLFRE